MTEANVNEDGGLGKVLVEQHGDFLRELLKTALKLVMEAEVAARCGAGFGERNEGRQNRRNGYRERNAYSEPSRSLIPRERDQ